MTKVWGTNQTDKYRLNSLVSMGSVIQSNPDQFKLWFFEELYSVDVNKSACLDSAVKKRRNVFSKKDALELDDLIKKRALRRLVGAEDIERFNILMKKRRKSVPRSMSYGEELNESQREVDLDKLILAMKDYLDKYRVASNV